MRYRIPFLWFLAVVVVLFVAGCGNDESAQPEAAFFASAPMEEDFVSNSAGYADTNDISRSLETSQFQDKLIIRSGNMFIVVSDTESTLGKINRLAAARGGWIVNSNIFDSGGVKRGNITIRIPAEEFEGALSDIKEMALEVTSEFTDSQDVTDEYVDLESRLSNLEATAARVRNFLDEARNVEEALAVNQELSRLEGDIEVIKGRMQYLSQSAAFSTIEIEITPDELNKPLEIGGWRPEGDARSALEALLNVLQGIGSLLIYVVILCLPLVVIFGIPAFFVIRFGYRRLQRRSEKNDEDGEEE